MTKPNPQLSIIIPTKNEQKNIERCLKSLKAQNYPQDKFEIIIVDNHSKDKTVSIAKKYTDKVYTHGNERSAQRNYGARHARGRYLFFCDADMQLPPPTAGEVVKLLNNKKTIVSVREMGAGKGFWGEVLSLERSCYLNEKDIHAARGFPKRLFNKVGGYDERMYAGEDWDLTLRCKAAKAGLLVTETTLSHHEKAKSIREIIKKDHYYVGNIHLFAQKHPKVFKKYASLRYRGWLFIKNYKNLLKKPIHTAALIAYKLLIHLYSRPHWKKNSVH
ncbi:glycosyltransferase [Candidatus Woesebacteria bacterium]|nr:glycosyltransferase [Candidatus Woesebacteria bacterium]